MDEPATTGDIWWGKINQKLPQEKFEGLRGHVATYLGEQQELFTQDLYAGADPAHRVRVRLVSSSAWHALFARNMFIRPPEAELAGFEPDYVILHAPHYQAQPARDGVRTSTAIALSFSRKLIVIAGTEYGGRDQEVDLYGHELEAAGGGRAADALQRQHERQGGGGAVLRPVRHRQDHPVLRPGAATDRR